MKKMARILSGLAMLAALISLAHAEEIGKIKKLSGDVKIERTGAVVAAKLGDPVHRMDRIVTGKDGAVGGLFQDDTRLSAGPNSTLSLDQFDFNPENHDGRLDVSIQKGTLSGISGKLTQKTPGALKVKTPTAILAVRGTEFSVSIDDPVQGGAPQ